MFYQIGDSFIERLESGDIRYYRPGDGRGNIGAIDTVIPKDSWVAIVAALTPQGTKWQETIQQADGASIDANFKAATQNFSELTGMLSEIYNAKMCSKCNIEMATPTIYYDTSAIVCTDCGKILCEDCAHYIDKVDASVARCQECTAVYDAKVSETVEVYSTPELPPYNDGPIKNAQASTDVVRDMRVKQTYKQAQEVEAIKGRS